ncbi:MAG: pyridoxal phosphate-dependent aminotransferase [Bacteroidia bacterium]|nr:pyridoxal phosphate-dependent aminotransferase [Bacteroidia bacterium]MCZ2277919.1 pyridoxal phosphate-dependent aminotransferase [Bacteroidia bacterium]
MIKLSDRIEQLQESQTLTMARISRELKEQGLDIISLSLGEPDFITPVYIREAAKKAIDKGYSHYPPISGYMDLRKAICEKFKNENNLIFSPDQIIVSTGAKQSIANAVLVTINPGDEVIVPAPYWVSYAQIIQLAGGTPVFITTSIESDFKITPQQLEAAISSKTRLFIYSSPCNPTGSVYSFDELKALSEVFAKHPNILIISDEIYEHINFIGKHESIAQFENIRNQVIIVNGVSKAYAMTGWRIGYLAADKQITKACDKMQGQFTSAASSIAQRAALAAISSNDPETIRMQTAFRRRRDLVVNLLSKIPGLSVNQPQGAFYVFPDVSSFFGKQYNGSVINTPEDLCMFLLKDAQVSLVTGEAFGDNNCLRISYAAADEKLVNAIERISKSLQKLS